MKYRNAAEILPDELLRELQKYAPGELLYVPSDKKRKQWGADSGARLFYEQRNEEIRHQYFHLGRTMEELCRDYRLSEETLRKIIYQ